MTNDDDRRAAAELLPNVEEYDHGCDCYDCCYLRTHTLPIIEQAFTAHRIAAERRGIERAAEVADEHACQHCAHISAAIRAITD